jgi:hypothetical protein
VADASWPRGSPPNDGWGPATPVRSAAADAPAPRAGRASTQPGAQRSRRGYPAGPSAAGAAAAAAARNEQRSAWDRLQASGPAKPVRGLSGWLSVLVLVAATVLGIVIDAMRGVQLGTGFNVGIIAGSVLGILLVRRSAMFPVVVAPPIVYSLGAGISLYVRSKGLHDRGVLIDAATNWLVYGFPAIAAASAAVLIIAGIRLITHR